MADKKQKSCFDLFFEGVGMAFSGLCPESSHVIIERKSFEVDRRDLFVRSRENIEQAAKTVGSHMKKNMGE